MLDSAFLYSYQSNKGAENRCLSLVCEELDAYDGNKNYDDLVPMSMAI